MSDNGGGSGGKQNGQSDSFSKWQEATREQLGSIVNLVLTALSLASLGFGADLLFKTEKGGVLGCARVAVLAGMGALLCAAAVGICVSLSRLCDFRWTAHTSRLRDLRDRYLAGEAVRLPSWFDERKIPLKEIEEIKDLEGKLLKVADDWNAQRFTEARRQLEALDRNENLAKPSETLDRLKSPCGREDAEQRRAQIQRLLGIQLGLKLGASCKDNPIKDNSIKYCRDEDNPIKYCRDKAKKFSLRTWILFRTQLALFGVGVLFLLGGSAWQALHPALPAEKTAGDTIMPVTVVAPPQPPVPPHVFTRNLSYGMLGNDVQKLQELLIQKNTGPAAGELKFHGATNYFGSLTKAALIEFQKKAGIKPASGFFGQFTRAYANNLE